MIICVRGATAPNSQWLLAAEFALDRGLSTLGVDEGEPLMAGVSDDLQTVR
jgi:hypothetical protein